jgi:hypothetical protein
MDNWLHIVIVYAQHFKSGTKNFHFELFKHYTEKVKFITNLVKITRFVEINYNSLHICAKIAGLFSFFSNKTVKQTKSNY